MKYDKNTIIDTAMQIIKDEHEFFVTETISDNSDHVQRIIRIAKSAGTLLSQDIKSKKEVDMTVARIIHFGRQLFIDEWMNELPDDDEPPRREDAIDEFKQYINKNEK